MSIPCEFNLKKVNYIQAASPSKELHTSATVLINSSLSQIFTLPLVLDEVQKKRTVALLPSYFQIWCMEHFHLRISTNISYRLSLPCLRLQGANKNLCHYPPTSSQLIYINYCGITHSCGITHLYHQPLGLLQVVSNALKDTDLRLLW